MTTFNATTADDLIRQYAWPLLVRCGDEVLASGTACLIGPSIVLTAKHVVEDYVDRFGVQRTPAGGAHGNYSIMLAQQAGGQQYLWQVDRTWLCGLSDIAVMRVSPFPADDPRPRPPWRRWSLGLFPPAPGTDVCGFGYHATSASLLADDSVLWQVSAATSRGRVVEIHRIARDRAMLPFPTFRLNARLDPSMSGGPIVNNETGELCGLVCASMPPPPGTDEPHVSYGASLWPAMGTVLWSPDAAGRQTLLDLARDGTIHAPESSRVVVTGIRHNDGGGHTVDLRAEFPLIDGVFHALVPRADGGHEVSLTLWADGEPMGDYVVVVAAGHEAGEENPAPRLQPPYLGPFDEAEFDRLLAQYVALASGTPSLGPVNFKMAAQHLGRRRRDEPPPP